MERIKFRKTNVTILQMFGLTAWSAVLLAIANWNLVIFVVLCLWSLSAIIAWFITDSTLAIFPGLAGGIFLVGMCWLVYIAVCILLWSWAGDSDSRGFIFLGTGAMFSLFGSIGGGIIGSKIHYH
jgi:hypothetical protein